MILRNWSPFSALDGHIIRLVSYWMLLGDRLGTRSLRRIAVWRGRLWQRQAAIIKNEITGWNVTSPAKIPQPAYDKSLSALARRRTIRLG